MNTDTSDNVSTLDWNSELNLQREESEAYLRAPVSKAESVRSLVRRRNAAAHTFLHRKDGTVTCPPKTNKFIRHRGRAHKCATSIGDGWMDGSSLTINVHMLYRGLTLDGFMHKEMKNASILCKVCVW